MLHQIKKELNMKSAFFKNLILLLLFCSSSTFAKEKSNNSHRSEYLKAKSIVDSISHYYDKDLDKHDFYAEQFNDIELHTLIDSNFRQLILDRTEFLRRNYKYREAIPILNNAIVVAESNKDSVSMASFHKMLSTLYYYLDNIDSTNYELDQAYELYIRLEDKAELGIISIRKARIEYDLGNYEKALIASFKALELNKEAGDEKKMAISYLQLGNTFFYLTNYRDSKKYFELAALLFEEADFEYGYYEAFSNIGLVEIKQGEYRKGMNKQFITLEYLKRDEYAIATGVTCNFLSDAYFELQLYDSSFYYTQLAKKEFEKSNFKQGLSECFLIEAKIFYKKKQFNNALESATNSYEIALKNSYFELLEESNF
jgi:tetratricopeptide (TPR) repeat protein